MENENRKICPMMSFRTALNPETIGAEESYCYLKECAWWDENNTSCGILTIAEHLKIKETGMPVG